MQVSEFIGFFIMIFALIFTAWQRRRQMKDQVEHPEKYARQEEKSNAVLRELLTAMDINPDEYLGEVPKPAQKKKKKPPAPPRQDFNSKAPPAWKTSPLRTEVKRPKVPSAYAIQPKKRQSTAARLAHDISDPRRLFLYHEIFGPPKGLGE